MRPLNLHLKTAILASTITLAAFAAALTLISVRVAVIVSNEQKERTKLQAINFAAYISHLPTPHDPRQLAHDADIIRRSRPDIIAVRVWDRVGNVYVKTAIAATDNAPDEPISEETIIVLRSGQESANVKLLPQDMNTSIYRLFSPITEQLRFEDDQTRLSGAVEILERLDTAPLIARRLESSLLLIAFATVFITTLAIYIFFRRLIYRPINRLLVVMSRAEAGDLDAKVQMHTRDDMGLLAQGYNRMIERIRSMSEEREARARILQERIHEATLELAKRNEQLIDLNRDLWETTHRMAEFERLAAAGQTVAQFAHEVGTPLNLISGHVQLLRTQLADNTRAESRLEIISTQIERISAIVRQMLNRTRSEAVTLEPLNLNALLLRTLDVAAITLERGGVQLEVKLADLPNVYANADRLQQVFINLISNAMDAMPHGGALRVHTGIANTSIGETNANIFVEFADTGSGINAEMRTRIFDPLYTTKGYGHGTGLGLVIVRQVVREHSGEIEVVSEEGYGALFRIILPANQIAGTV